MTYGISDELHNLMFGAENPTVTPELVVQRLREEARDAREAAAHPKTSADVKPYFESIGLLLHLAAEYLEARGARIVELESRVVGLLQQLEKPKPKPKPKVPTIIMCRCGWKGQQRELRANRTVTCRLDCPSCGAEFVETPKDMPL